MITSAVCNSFKTDSADGVHQPGDTYKIALYISSAVLNESTTAYTSAGEASGTGYVAGGTTLAGRVSALSGNIEYLDWTDPVWLNSSITARGCLIYNASQSNKALVVLDFGSDVVSANGPFTVLFPPAGSTAVIRFQ